MYFMSQFGHDVQPWELEGIFDPWETALGKAYLHLFNEVGTALNLLHGQKPFEADVVLLNAQRAAEEILMDYNHPLDIYMEEETGRAE